MIQWERPSQRESGTYNHVFMTRIRDNLSSCLKTVSAEKTTVAIEKLELTIFS